MHERVAAHLAAMVPIENERGARLLSIKEIDETAAEVLPVAFSLVIGRHSSGYLLVRNTRRGIWELPGGFIDAGESARQCATRELKEESGQHVANLRWRAALEIEVECGSTARTVYGALYCTDIDTPSNFSGNSEIGAIGFWPESELPVEVSAIDKALLSYYA
ncbi:NUDIX domain-containing protein [Pseudoxanthomonas wuyuanensis]|uniref:NUDIX domain-containing protein n=1 Tax=Pseudoxanthomonas wuyuanensis TaxID=1073196 RepID=UPI001EE448F0|nr:NUDIX hydrolase [Pseudoxanthomonas wuyuanensis]